jgi:hypothetical protein
LRAHHEPKIFKIDEKITYKSDFHEKIDTRVGNLIKDKALSDEANELLYEYIKELINRSVMGEL